MKRAGANARRKGRGAEPALRLRRMARACRTALPPRRAGGSAQAACHRRRSAAAGAAHHTGHPRRQPPRHPWRLGQVPAERAFRAQSGNRSERQGPPRPPSTARRSPSLAARPRFEHKAARGEQPLRHFRSHPPASPRRPRRLSGPSRGVPDRRAGLYNQRRRTGVANPGALFREQSGWWLGAGNRAGAAPRPRSFPHLQSNPPATMRRPRHVSDVSRRLLKARPPVPAPGAAAHGADRPGAPPCRAQSRLLCGWGRRAVSRPPCSGIAQDGRR